MIQDKDVTPALTYAQEVVTGNLPACIYICKVCQQFIDELQKQDETFPFYFDEKAAGKVVRFCQLFTHTKGQWAGQLIKLEPCQTFFIAIIFGWKRKSDHTRRYRRALLFVPRKAGKSLLAALIGLYMLTADGEAGAEVYCAAKNENQAKEIMNAARNTARANPDFLEFAGAEVNAETITCDANNAIFKSIIGRPLDGSSPSAGICDEVHGWDNDRVYQSLLTGMGARRQPLLLVTSTAGNPNTFFHDYVRDCQALIDNNDYLSDQFSLIYTLDKDDDWTNSDLVIRKAHPNIGVSVEFDFIAKQIEEAKRVPRNVAHVKTKYLNVWHGTSAAYYDNLKFAALVDSTLKLSDFKGRECYVGVDLALKDDLTAIALLFPDPADKSKYTLFCRSFLPENSIIHSSNNYLAWQESGWLESHPGDVIDFNVLQKELEQVIADYDVKAMCFDPAHGGQIMQFLDEKYPDQILKVKQNALGMTAPMTHLDGLILTGRIKHNGNPVLAWCLSNVIAKKSGDFIKPDKQANTYKIDCISATLTALSEAMKHEIIDEVSMLDLVKSLNA